MKTLFSILAGTAIAFSASAQVKVHWVTTNGAASAAIGGIITNGDVNVRYLLGQTFITNAQSTISNSASIFAGSVLKLWNGAGQSWMNVTPGNNLIILDSGVTFQVTGSGHFTGSGQGLFAIPGSAINADSLPFTSLAQDVAGLLTNNVSWSNALNNTGGVLNTNGGISISGTMTAGSVALTSGFILTNNESQATTFSNNVTVDAAHTLTVTTLNATTMNVNNMTVTNLVTATNLLVITGLTNNGANVLKGAVMYATNQNQITPDFTIPSQLMSTNAAFTFLAPVGIDTTKLTMQTTAVYVTNTTAAAVAVTAPANCHAVGTMYVTNLTRFTFECYAQKFTNCFAFPVF